jgi:hypothetical protein
VSYYRQRQAFYPDLEEALFDLQQQLQNSKVPITGDLLKSLATRLWDNLEQYKGKPSSHGRKSPVLIASLCRALGVTKLASKEESG